MLSILTRWERNPLTTMGFEVFWRFGTRLESEFGQPAFVCARERMPWKFLSNPQSIGHQT